jgi:hypothetical protein
MKKFAIAFLMLTTPANAYEHFECSKHDGEVSCKTTKQNVMIDDIKINNGNCSSDTNASFLHKTLMKGEKFVVPGSKECFYVSGVTITLKGGHVDHIPAM